MDDHTYILQDSESILNLSFIFFTVDKHFRSYFSMLSLLPCLLVPNMQFLVWFMNTHTTLLYCMGQLRTALLIACVDAYAYSVSSKLGRRCKLLYSGIVVNLLSS